MTKNRMTVVFSSDLSEFRNVDDRFDRGILRIAYHGKNHNRSDISREAFEKATATAVNCPVVCRYDREDDEIGSHDMEYVSDGESGKFVNLTEPVGIVPESAAFWWETIDDNGVEHEYLCTDILLWKRQEAYDKIRRNGITSESMEIKVLNGSSGDDGYYHIDEFEFTAFCLLGTAEPCFENASVELFSMSKQKEAYMEMLEDMKRSASEIGRSFSVQPEESGCNTVPEGVEKMNEKMKLIESYGLTVDDLDFSIEDTTEEELAAKLEEMKDQKFELTAGQFLEELMAMLGEEKVNTEYGECSKWIYIDHDVENAEVFAYNRIDWKVYGMKYSVNGDAVAIDFASEHRKKMCYVDFEDGAEPAEESFSIGSEIISAMKYASDAKQSELDAAWSEKYNAKEAEFSSVCAERDELLAYKNENETGKFENAVNDVLAGFENLNGNEMFEKLRTDHEGMTLEEIEAKCFEIRGRTMQFSAAVPAIVKIPVNTSRAPVGEEPYGGIVKRHINK